MANTSAATASSTTSSPSDVPKYAASVSCATCSEEFSSPELQRAHMRSDYHVYNLKRRVAELLPITSKAFDELMRDKLTEADENSEDSLHRWCSVCQKQFSNVRSYRAHLRSRKHLECVVETQDENVSSEHDLSRTPDMLSASDSDDFELVDDEDEFIPTLCLFCTHQSSTLDDNIDHMSTVHSLFIPSPEHLLDLETFIGYLFTLISEFHECLYCGAEKSSMEAVQHHMLAKGHCMINSEDARPFYDFPIPEESDKEGKRAAYSSSLLQSADKLASQRSQTPPQRRNPLSHLRPERKAITDAASANRAVTIRSVTGTSMLGVSPQRQRALRVAERKVLKLEIKARNAFQARLEKESNRQKHFRRDTPGPRLG